LGHWHNEIKNLGAKDFLLVIVLLVLGESVIHGVIVVDGEYVGVVDHEVGEHLLLLRVLEHLLDEPLEVLGEVLVLTEAALHLVQVLSRLRLVLEVGGRVQVGVLDRGVGGG